MTEFNLRTENLHAPVAGGRPLDGLEVVEFGQFLAGPYCGMLLADMGARVTKVERPGTGDLSRGVGLRAAGGEGTTFLSLNRNKRSITLDVTRPEGQEIARSLVLRADVLVQNMQPGTLDRWGLGYADLRPLAPRLVYCSISAFGEDGPYAGLSGIDPLIQAMGGMMALTGEADGPPVMVGAPIADYAGAMNAVQGVLAALLTRQRTGYGQAVHVNLLGALIAAILPREWDYFATGARPPRMGSAHRYLAPYQAYATADGWLYVAVLDDARFQRVVHLMGLDGVAADDRFMTNNERVVHREELNTYLIPRFRERSTEAWLADCRSADVLAAPIYELDQTFQDPQVRHNGVVITLPDPERGPLPSIRPGFRLDDADDIPLRPPPALGADTDEVLAEACYTTDQVEDLRSRGVI